MDLASSGKTQRLGLVNVNASQLRRATTDDLTEALGVVLDNILELGAAAGGGSRRVASDVVQAWRHTDQHIGAAVT